MNKAFKIPLNPTPDQLGLIKQTGGAVRWLWNTMLKMNIEKYESEKKFNFQFDMNRLTIPLRKEFPWLKEVNSQVLQQKNRDLDATLKRAISKVSGFPKFKSKHHCSDSFRVPQHFKVSKRGVLLPKIGWVRWKPNRKLIGKVKNITIKQDGDKWFAVVLCETPTVTPRSSFMDSEVVGIDVGIKDFVVLSDGIKVSNPKHLEKAEAKLKKYQRALSKKVKGSNNRNKAKKKLRKIHHHVSNQRKDFQYKLVHSITKKYQVVCVENLNIKGMMKNRKLSKSISSAGWYSFKQRMKQKLEETGGMLVSIDRFSPSSKMCGGCGAINNSLKLSDRTWTCDCGTTHDRDLNAANNIKTFGLTEINRLGICRIYACGESANKDIGIPMSGYNSMKQENLFIGKEAN